MHKGLLLVVLSCCVFCGGCFRKWVMTDKEIREHYRNKPSKPTFFTIQNDSVKLFCATSGADTLPPLILIHGAPGAWYGSRTLLDDTIIQKKFHIIAMDRLGYNKSRYKNRKRPVTSLRLQAIAINEALRLNRSQQKGVVLGSSYGAPIAAEVAMLYPEKFYHLFLLAAALDPDKEKFWWFHKYIHRGPFHWFLPRFLRSATDEKFAHIKELRMLDLKWAELAMPVTVVQGGSDKIVDPSNLEYAKRRLTGKPAEFIFLPTAGHMIRFSEPDLVRKLLLGVAR